MLLEQVYINKSKRASYRDASTLFGNIKLEKTAKQKTKMSWSILIR